MSHWALWVVNLLRIVIRYRDDPGANAILLGFAGISPLKAGFTT